MGVFLLLSADYRIGAAGPYRITANEVAIGITMPRAAIELTRQRLTPAHFHRALVLADVYAPDEAVTAGFFDRVVPTGELADAARTAATRLAQLDAAAHAATKLRTRDATLQALRAALDGDDLELRPVR
jgi:enoyl-CoA hydratase